METFADYILAEKDYGRKIEIMHYLKKKTMVTVPSSPFRVTVQPYPFISCRIVPCFALPQSYPIFAYRGISIPLLCSYRSGSQGLSTTYEQAHVVLDLLTLAS